jgi:hypothetical protein
MFYVQPQLKTLITKQLSMSSGIVMSLLYMMSEHDRIVHIKFLEQLSDTDIRKFDVNTAECSN